MTILDRYMSKRVAITFFNATLALVALVVLIDLLTHRREDIEKYGVPAAAVVEYYLLYIPRVLYEFQIAPVAVLVAGLLVFGRAAQDQEVTAALAGGISLRRLARWPLLFGAALSVGLFAMHETFGADAIARNREMEDFYFSRNPDMEREGISWANLGDGWAVHVLKFNRPALTGENVIMDNFREDEIIHVEARRIYWEPEREQWMMEDGVWATFYPEQEMANRYDHFSLRPAPIEEAPEDLFALEEMPVTKGVVALAEDIRRAENRGMRVAPVWVDYHTKFSMPVLCFVMMLLAIPFALRIGRGGIAIGFGAAIAIGLAYLVVFATARSLGQLTWIPPVVAAWFANVLFGALGIVLFIRTPT